MPAYTLLNPPKAPKLLPMQSPQELPPELNLPPSPMVISKYGEVKSRFWNPPKAPKLLPQQSPQELPPELNLGEAEDDKVTVTYYSSTLR